MSGASLVGWVTAWLYPPSGLGFAVLLLILIGTGFLLLSLPSYGLFLVQWFSGKPGKRRSAGGRHRDRTASGKPPARTVVVETESLAAVAEPGCPPEHAVASEPEADSVSDRRELDLLLQAAAPADAEDRGRADTRCKMDLAATSDGLELILELPGIEANELDIRFTDGAITISGEIKRPSDWTDRYFRVVERDYGLFSRSLELPEGVQTDRIKAVLNLGLLKVTIPNPIKPEPKKIVVQAGPMHLNPTMGGLELTVDLPGLEAQDVEVTVSGDLLIVHGERRPVSNTGGEAGPAAFSRAIELPEGANIEQISAALGMGVLKVTIPIPTKRESKKIDVRTAA